MRSFLPFTHEASAWRLRGLRGPGWGTRVTAEGLHCGHRNEPPGRPESSRFLRCRGVGAPLPCDHTWSSHTGTLAADQPRTGPLLLCLHPQERSPGGVLTGSSCRSTRPECSAGKLFAAACWPAGASPLTSTCLVTHTRFVCIYWMSPMIIIRLWLHGTVGT